MKIAVAGASGFVGSALIVALAAAGHSVVRLVRREVQAEDEVSWDPSTGKLDEAQLRGVDAIINLAGENIGAGRWTAKRRERIFRSRVDVTKTLVAAMARMPLKPGVFLSASAVGFYGDRGDEQLDEGSSMGHGFLPEVCLVWETHAGGAARNGIRTVLLRFGIVIGPNGGALPKMLPLFRLGFGGPLSTGRQWMSWVAIDDVVGAILHALVTSRLEGAVNVVAPNPVRNMDFARALGQAVHRPAFVRTPAWALRIIVGRAMADEALLASARAAPVTLLQAGYVFRAPELEPFLRAIL